MFILKGNILSSRKAYFYPFLSENNRYSSLQQESIKNCGFQNLPFNALLKELFNFSKKKNNVVVVNWLESQVVMNGGNISPKYFMLFFIKIFLIFLCRIKFIWVRHNYASHNASGLALWVSNFFQWCLEEMADVVVCHSKDYLQVNDVYIPHPLYFEGDLVFPCKLNRGLNFIFIGAVMPYKGIYELLEIWPKDIQLTVFGKLTDTAFGEELRSIVKTRGLSVEFKFGFVSESKLYSLLTENDVLVIPNKLYTSYVSGNYFLAKSFGMNVLARKGTVDLSISEMGTYTYAGKEGLISSITKISSSITPRNEIQKQAVEFYGKSAVERSWRELLN